MTDANYQFLENQITLEQAKEKWGIGPVKSQFVKDQGKEIGYLFDIGRYQNSESSDFISRCTLCSAGSIGDVRSYGVPPEKTKIDDLGRICQVRTSQKPSSSGKFLEPIRYIYLAY